MTSPRRLSAEIDDYLATASSTEAATTADKARGRRIRISATNTATMSAGAINKELDRLDARNSELGQQMIDEGRGFERPSDYQNKTDPLSSELNQISDRRMNLRIEIQSRYGPGAPSRLPRNFGTRR